MILFIGIGIGVLLTSFIFLIIRLIVGSSGVLVVDTSDPEKDVYTININGDLHKLPKKKIVLLTVSSS